MDTGAQVSCCPVTSGDTLDPSLSLETVDGSKMPCYGKKEFSFRIGRKTYHQTVYITNTSETILGMDFIMPHRMEFRWSEYGDYYIYDKKSNISGLLEFIKIPKGALPHVARISKVSVVTASNVIPSSSSPDWDLFQVAAIKSGKEEPAVSI